MHFTQVWAVYRKHTRTTPSSAYLCLRVLCCFVSLFFFFFTSGKKIRFLDVSDDVSDDVSYTEEPDDCFDGISFHIFLKTHLTNSQTSLVSAHGCSGCYPLLSKHMHMVAPSETMSKQHEASR